MTVHASMPIFMDSREVERFFEYCNRAQEDYNYLPLVVGADLNFDVLKLKKNAMKGWCILPALPDDADKGVLQKDYILMRSCTNARFIVDCRYTKAISWKDLLYNEPLSKHFLQDFLTGHNHRLISSWLVIRQKPTQDILKLDPTTSCMDSLVHGMGSKSD